MTLVYADRVKETSSTTGTGTYALAGAVTGFQSFSVVGNGNTCYYAATDGTNWEVGLGTWSTGGSLARTTIEASSNGGSAVSWSSTVTLWLDLPAAAINAFISVAAGTSGNVLTSNGTTWASAAPITLLTPANTSSGTSWSWTLPGTQHVIYIDVVGFSMNGSVQPVVQIGNGTAETSGYTSVGATILNGSSLLTTATNGFTWRQNQAGHVSHGRMTLTLENSSSNTWTETHMFYETVAPFVFVGAGSKSTTGAVTTLKLTMDGTVAGDAGQVNVSYQ